MSQEQVKSITKKSQDFSQWYNDVVLKAELADYGPVRGTMVIRPYGYAIWEAIQAYLDRKIKEMDVPNAYFPLFIPESFLKKEKEHVEGFSPELAVVTIGGGEKLAEPVVVRPTSETVMYSLFSKWISSWRDLPYKVNQWANIVRWEKRPYLFLRTTEFLWQEGHTAHATHEEAVEQVLAALERYQQVYRDLLGIAGVMGVKSQKEKFAGAVNTYTYEMLMPDGKALQGCTSHDLGQNFSQPFKITFQSKEGKDEFVWQTSWGMSTRSIGGLIMEHGDDRGLILPPKVAPIQIVIVPILAGDNAEKVEKYAEEINQELKDDFRVHMDNRDSQTPGWKFNEWELKGVPIRLEIGPREMEANEVSIVRRDTGEKFKDQRSKLKITLKRTIETIQSDLLLRSETFLKENTHTADDYEEFKKIMSTSRGLISAFWCENVDCEEKIKAETKASIRCRPFGLAQGKPLDAKEESGLSADKAGKCVLCGKEAKYRWLFGQAY